MKRVILITIFFSIFYIGAVCQSNEGPVLKKELIGKYEGELKKGRAQGKGTAIGRDSYTGRFYKGLPEGEGIYTDSEGNKYKGSFHNGIKDGKGELILKGTVKDSVIVGYWASDKYIGKEKKDPYEISNQTGIVTARLFNNGPGNNIEIGILDPVNSTYLSATIFLIGQATARTSYGKYFYDDATFPVEFDIQYTCSNKLKTATIANTIRIKINQPGNWVITLKN